MQKKDDGISLRYQRWLLKNISLVGLDAQVVSQTEEEKHYEWYIEEQMKNYVDDETILRWEGEEVKVKDLKEVADALTDILYVTYGAGCAYGIDLDKCFKEVQRANMSKLGLDGKPIYNEKGKVMKGPNYSEPNLKPFVK